jgi:hypothetical protein
MKISLIARITMVAVCLGSGVASGAEHGFYAGGGWSSVSADYAPPRQYFVGSGASGLPDLGPDALRLYAGFRPLDWLAFEASYSRFAGNTAPTHVQCVTVPCPYFARGEVSAAALSLLALYPHGPFDFYARAGASWWRAKVELFDRTFPVISRARDSGTQATVGAGIQFHVARIATRLEYERLRFGADAADLFTLGLAYAF